MDTHSAQVLIAGGGPTGLTAALLLARAGVAVTLVERRPGTSIHPRARGLNVRTMEIFRSLGLEAPIRAAGSALGLSGRGILGLHCRRASRVYTPPTV